MADKFKEVWEDYNKPFEQKTINMTCGAGRNVELGNSRSGNLFVTRVDGKKIERGGFIGDMTYEPEREYQQTVVPNCRRCILNRERICDLNTDNWDNLEPQELPHTKTTFVLATDLEKAREYLRWRFIETDVSGEPGDKYLDNNGNERTVPMGIRRITLSDMTGDGRVEEILKGIHDAAEREKTSDEEKLLHEIGFANSLYRSTEIDLKNYQKNK